MKSEACVRRMRQYTDAMNHLIDRSVGTVIRAVKDAGLWEDTIVVYTSDHGEYLGEYGLVRKSLNACNALNRVPFVLRVPGANLPAECSAPMSNADVFPTLCGLAGVEVPADVQGRSILPVLQGAAPKAVPVFAHDNLERNNQNFSLYDERYRFTYYPQTGERMLFDHGENPYEVVNRAGDPALKAVEERLFQELLLTHMQSDQPHGGRLCRW